MCIPRFDSPSIFGTLLDRRAGSFRVGPYGTVVPLSVRYVPGTMIIETTWMTPSGWIVVHDGLTIGPWHDDHADETSHTRPPTDHDADHMMIRHIECIQGHGSGRGRVRADVRLRADGGPAGRWSSEDWSAADASDGETVLRLISDLRIGIEGNRARARHTVTEGEERFVALGWRHGLNGPDLRQRQTAAPDHVPLLARLARRRSLPGPSVAPAPAALGADPEGPDVRADRRDGGGADDLAARDDRWRTQLGLPLLLDARRDVHTVGAARARLRLGGRRLHAVRRRSEAQRRRRAADHVRGRRRARPDRAHAGRPERVRRRLGPCGSATARIKQRQNDVYGAVLDSIYLHTKRRRPHAARLWPVLEDQVRCAIEVWEPAGPGHLGGARRAQALRVLEADVLGGARSWREPRGAHRRGRARK